MLGPAGSSPYVTQPGSVLTGPTVPPSSYPPPNYPFPSTNASPGIISSPSSGPFSSTTPPPQVNNSTLPSQRPVDRLPPEDLDYPVPSDPKKPGRAVPNMSDSDFDPADINADRGAGGARNSTSTKSNSEDFIKELDRDGEIPGDSAKKDPQIDRSGFTNDADDDFVPPSAFTPDTETKSEHVDLDDPAEFMHKDEAYRGIVKYDDVEQLWYLQYEPVSDLETGEGIIYLAENAKLSSARNNSRIYVEGTLDQNQQDRFGRPLLVIRYLKIKVLNPAR